jgi:transcriptional regulator with GAF, ATPase, and Fis domain
LNAEGTLTKYEANGSSYFILILRNIIYKIEAEEKLKSLSIETEILREEIRNIYNLEEIVGNSSCILEAMRSVHRVASTNTTVLLTGETGTGKELFARAIHKASPRMDKPLIKLNCAALPASLIESELFGHEKGAFTGAVTRRSGKFGLADEGTIFLDEVSELPLELQAKLLRVLQEGEFDTIGGNKTIKVNVRVIAATNQDLHNLVNAGKFRNDLYYRLNIFPIQIPPLRDRGDDIIRLAEAFLKKFSKQMNKKISGLSLSDRQKLISYRWPGNVRELQNIIERAVITSDDGVLNLNLEKTDSDSISVDEINNKILTITDLLTLEKENILRAIKICNGKISGPNGAASLLEMPTSTLTSKMKALGISH